jgi:uncharacterized protein YbjT (DUF2867 family)
MYLVSGATGNTGSDLVGVLADGGEDVRALTRNPAKITPRDRVEIVTGDLDQPESLREAMSGIRGMFLLPGYRDMPGLLAEARHAGVERVVLLSTSAAASGDTSNAISRYAIESEDVVRRSGIDWTVLRAYGFMSNTLRWLPELTAGDVVKEPFPGVPVAMVDPFDIATVAATALRDDGHDGQTYVLSGPEALLPADRLRILGTALHRDLRLDELDPDAAVTLLNQQLPKPYADAMVDYYLKGTLDESQPTDTVERVTARAPRTFRQWVESHLTAFGEGR